MSPRAIEVGFPIAEINRLAVPERNSFKPIYQMHKWFARRASCVFRAILLGALKPALRPDGKPTDIMEEYYKDHSSDPETQGALVVDPFMGGGTTVVEALRLGCRVIGNDLNPVAWFIVKTEVEPVDLEKLKKAYERLAARPVDWNEGRPLAETLKDLYKTELAPGCEADVIYTFWVKHAVCTAGNCHREVPLFKDYFIAQKTMSVRYHKDARCPRCHERFDWEIEPATLIAEPSLMVNAPRGSAGEGRPTAKWAYAPEPPKPKDRATPWLAKLKCPCCRETVSMSVPAKRAHKKVSLSVLLCPACEAVWQRRGQVPDEPLQCPSCRHGYDPREGNVPDDGMFRCACGQRDDIIASIRRLPQEKRLPIRPYAIQAYYPINGADDDEDEEQGRLFETGGRRETKKRPPPNGFLVPKNGKFFRRFTASDQARLRQAEQLWERHKNHLPCPKSKIPLGDKTKSGLLAHHYNYWHEMFAPRQLLALSTLLRGVMEEPDSSQQEMLLCAFSATVGRNNLFCRYFNDRNTIQEIFSRHDYQPKTTTTEGNVFGLESIRGTFPQMFARVIDGKGFGVDAFDWRPSQAGHSSPYTEVHSDRIVRGENAKLECRAIKDLALGANKPACFITDPPYVGNVNYAELADFYYVWLRLPLKGRYAPFRAEYTPKVEEIIENQSRGKGSEDFFRDLAAGLKKLHDSLSDGGLLAFTFHHMDSEGEIWEGLLQALCETGFEISAVYPVHGDKESSSHHQGKENVTYDLIHLCRKRTEEPGRRSWAGIRQEVRRRAREELAAIEKGRYGKQLPAADVRLVCIGKCLELFSAHYGKVLDHEGKPLPLREALQDISTIVDQLVTPARKLPPELEGIDPLSYAWLRVLMPVRREVSVNEVNKELRAMRVAVDDLKRAGLIIRGRTGRGQSYEVKQPLERLNDLKESLRRRLKPNGRQARLFENGEADFTVPLADLLHLLIGLSEAGEPVTEWLEKLTPLRPQIRAGLRFVGTERPDWKAAADRVLDVMEGAPLLDRMK